MMTGVMKNLVLCSPATNDTVSLLYIALEPNYSLNIVTDNCLNVWYNKSCYQDELETHTFEFHCVDVGQITSVNHF